MKGLDLKPLDRLPNCLYRLILKDKIIFLKDFSELFIIKNILGSFHGYPFK